jgi:DNA-binding transcriptional ArsR family regulator
MDAELLNALAHTEALKVLEILLKGPATRKEIAAASDIRPSRLNYRMMKLEAVGLVRRDRSHGPWELGVASDAVQEFLLTLAEIGMSIKAEEFDLQRKRVSALREHVG